MSGQINERQGTPDERPSADLHDREVSEKMPLKHELENRLGDSHVNLLPKKKLVICLLVNAFCLFVCFLDQTSPTVALPAIAEDLGAQNSINWAGTSSLLANCVCQVLFGRFADIFGRKNMLMGSLAMLLIANMLCGFAKTGPQYYVFRAFAGIGVGGTQSMGMVILSDVVTLKQRGKFQGILGSAVGLGNAVGPIIMAVYVENSTWRNFYRTLPPIMAAVIVVVYFVIEDNKKQSGSVLSMREKWKKIDYVGIFFATAGLTLLLIPISGGGSTYAWDSDLVIAMFVVGGVCTIIFLIVEWKIPELPMIPVYIFKNMSLSFLLLSTFLYGIAYFGFLFIISYYFQLVKGQDALHSAYYLLPLVLMQAIMSITAGNIISYTGHWIHVVISGYSFWITGAGMTIAWKENTGTGMIVGTLLVMGVGIGFIFQPTMVAVQANATMAQRAVVIGTRNVLRAFGGALGVACATLIVSNSLINEIDKELGDSAVPRSFLINLKANIYTKADLSGLTELQKDIVRKMYMKSIRNVFYFTIPLLGICLILSFLVKDRGLQCLDQQPEKKDKESTETDGHSSDHASINQVPGEHEKEK
ncbi:hypothetical protein FT663_03462 [Candidozyma haemuli var. vulneris]|uniref:Major facilitator superfamily (MFS) profile domain-containing protein n=1 Tax=Candidozyma haemuli TaxID=45357 RepID=A0A2V1AXG9_9ASCO|nr:hypothetical protein CXQ85_000532 [[Candida] haemuloni]KAF3988256.1 hypothetical protein FT662_03527 [[Candida] haemuloni var. vulneris]KAF3989801.1 hypothetical protein FT663_03462 [[Candida] haemuloni var. vulneris]PVH21551.1 hypothetical protein CXQ85_000532 [[Candida] haemuloni]